MFGRTPSRITAGPPTGMNGKHCIRAMVGRTPTRITAGPPTGMNEMDCIRAMIRAIKQRSLHDFPSGRAMLTSRISQRQNSPGSAFKGSIRLEIASHRNKIAIKPTVSNAQAINQAFKFPIALNNSSISLRFFCSNSCNNFNSRSGPQN